MGIQVIPVHPKLSIIDDIAVIDNLSNIQKTVDTLCLYIGANRSQLLVNEIAALNPKRVVFNPGTESEFLEDKLSQAGISFVHDCTLIMLESNQFNLN